MMLIIDHDGNRGMRSSCRHLEGEGESSCKRNSPLPCSSPFPRQGLVCGELGALRSRAWPGSSEHRAWGLSPETKKRLRSSLAHGDSWLSHITSVQGMERFALRRGGGAGFRREAALHVEASAMSGQKGLAASPPKPGRWPCATRLTRRSGGCQSPARGFRDGEELGGGTQMPQQGPSHETRCQKCHMSPSKTEFPYMSSFL